VGDTTTRQRWFEIAHILVIMIVLGQAALRFIRLPNKDEPAIAVAFILPVFASFVVLFKPGQLAHLSVQRFFRRFLTVVGIAVLLGEQDILFANLKPQFPGLPAREDRILTFYLLSYVLFLGIWCPPFVLFRALYAMFLEPRTGPAPLVHQMIWLTASVLWLIVVGLLAAFLPRIAGRLF
jgi:hypothetical protein